MSFIYDDYCLGDWTGQQDTGIQGMAYKPNKVDLKPHMPADFDYVAESYDEQRASYEEDIMEKPGDFNYIIAEDDDEISNQLANLQKTVVCPICLGFLEDVKTLAPCGHLFCCHCIVSSLQAKLACPSCNTPASKDECISWPQSQKDINKIILLVQRFTAGGAESAANISIGEIGGNAACRLPLFRVGDLVYVNPRCWPGINKQGGTARVVTVDDEEFTYTVKYVLDNRRDVNVPETFIEVSNESDGRPRREARAFSSTLTHHRDDSFINNLSMTSTSSTMSGRRCSSGGGGTRSRRGGDEGAAFHYAGKKRARPTRVVLLCSSLEEDEKKDVEAFSLKYHALISTHFDETITHLIVSVDEMNMFPQRTMKYMQSIMTGLWVVSAAWVSQSISSGVLVDEEPFEVRDCSKSTVCFASQRAREDITRIRLERDSNGYDNVVGDADMMMMRGHTHGVRTRTKRLFESVGVLLAGHFVSPGPPRSDFEDLLRRGEGQFTSDLDAFLNFRARDPEGPCSSSSSTSSLKYVS